jgi:aspartate carbamoyltransferase catalytic subunit
MKLKHLLSTRQFKNSKMVEGLLDLAALMESSVKANKVKQSLKGKIIACLFFEPSTRTRLSFSSAILRLGGGLIQMENGILTSSVSKGETIEDTTKIVNGYADCIVMRHPLEGSAERAAKVSQIPIINAGDGGHEHPTQALIDVYTIRKEKRKLTGLNIAMVGDLLYGRTTHSLLTLMSLFPGNKFYFVAPDRLKMPREFKNLLKSRGAAFEETAKFEEIYDKADVIYMTRVQKERFAFLKEYESLKNSYILDKKVMKKLKKDALILHPLPRINEISPEIDSDPRAGYFRQARNGVFVRMAILQSFVA